MPIYFQSRRKCLGCRPLLNINLDRIQQVKYYVYDTPEPTISEDGTREDTSIEEILTKIITVCLAIYVAITRRALH